MDSVRTSMTGKSRVKTWSETSLNGVIAPLVPTTASELKKFEPMMLPSVSSFCPRRAEAMADASSGSEVPAAMTVSPTNSSETPKDRAIPTAPQTRMCDDATSTALATPSLTWSQPGAYPVANPSQIRAYSAGVGAGSWVPWAEIAIRLENTFARS